MATGGRLRPLSKALTRADPRADRRACFAAYRSILRCRRCCVSFRASDSSVTCRNCFPPALFGWTPSRGRRFCFAFDDPQRLAAWLLENGADPNAVDAAGETAMHAAIDHGNAAAAAVISRKGGDLTLERLSDGLTSVELAIESGDVRCRRVCPAVSVRRCLSGVICPADG